jgi:electron transport complex protein RnfA
MRAAVGIGIATAVVMTAAALIGWVADTLLLVPLGLQFLRTPMFVLAVAATALLLSVIAARFTPDAVGSWGVSIPEVAVNCASVGVVLLLTRSGFTAPQAVLGGLSAGGGYLLVTAVMTAIREKLDVESVPHAFRGLPLHLISAGLLAFAFLAFDRAFLARVLGG